MIGGRSPLLWRVALLALVLIAVGREPARAQQNLEDAVKATFLHRFGSFADWPPGAFTDAAAPLVVCVAGSASFAHLVEERARNQRIAERAIVVRNLAIVSPGTGCHILYIAYDSTQGIRDALQATTGDPVLTVTDSQFGNVRGAIHFVLSDGRVRFHIDRRAAERNGVTLSSRLLSIALSVSGVNG
ncbi:YfiR family protein [Terricaulis sp.]|uniref:YfiR family protein n=1 Tax=Terricaulis sp. TaxID=2768686 RepID=UPI002AC703FB|nr:YfiR family protein [Terricaulis sp.]MDZ4691346.1 YfiR family protein [Terricaulis sp.]